jgi:hypothetical protein
MSPPDTSATGADLTAWRGRVGFNKRPAAAAALGVSIRTLVRYEQEPGPIPLTIALAAAAIEKGLKPIRSAPKK